MSIASHDGRAVLASPATKVSGSLTKRALDISVAGVALLFVAPLMLVVAALILLDSRGPVFFRQRRTGLNGIEFRIFKFRSMRVMEDGDKVQQAKKDDDRVTRVGGVIRRLSIDELPQLFNVLHGDMSLVGPRPHALAHDETFAALAPDYDQRFRARPGITGLAQVEGYRGEIRNVEEIVRRIELDNTYIETWSIWSDIGILIKTAIVVPFHRSAY